MSNLAIATLGVPRIGLRRELKSALESHWAGRTDAAELLATAARLRAESWRRQQALGITHIPSNDFSLYDHVLDLSVMVGAIPAVYGWHGGPVPLSTYFAMARGTQGRPAGDPAGDHGTGPGCDCGGDHAVTDGVPAQEMTKWFDTNYHFMVPEVEPGQRFQLAGTKPVDEFLEARALGIHTRPVLLGPVTWLLLAKSRQPGFRPLTLLEDLLPVYAEVLRRLRAAGADWVQMDEPCLVLDLDGAARTALRRAYAVLASAAPGLKLLVASYFGPLGDNLDTALSLPVAGLHLDLDLVRGAGQLDAVLAGLRPDACLSLGVIDGRNVWRADLPALLDRIAPAVRRLGTERLMLAPSCSLLHVPMDSDAEVQLDPELRSWLAFAAQKMTELAVLGRALTEGSDAVAADLAAAAKAVHGRRTSPRIHNPAVAARLEAVTADMARRIPYAERRWLQAQRLHLPVFPTTSIGSFPQTDAVRKARADHAKGRLSAVEYETFLRQETGAAIRWQEEIGIDVLVHGEFERNDMVQYFGEQLEGYVFTRHGWVQSYGSRCVRPPIIVGDVSRPRPMTVGWAGYAQSLTERPVKGMLTGPVTMLHWSFVRDDLPRATVCRQIALALRDEVTDLEAAGIAIIQIDEPALREGLPLRRADGPAYLNWAVESFRLAACGVGPATQIHTHMCYSEFNDIIAAIGALDADVISIETSRSKMELLDAFADYRYPNEIGPGVYDIHSPRVPTVAEMVDLLVRAGKNLSPDQIWVNPDCGLKTRRWEEVRPALANMVSAARTLRSQA